MARLRGKPRSARSVRPDLPARAEAVLLRALALKSEQRYQTMQAFAEDLGTIAGKGVSAPAVREVTPSRQRQRTAVRVLWRWCTKCGDVTGISASK